MKSGVESGATPLGNRYRILRELGQGGFGQTYVVEDLHRFNELCVLKKFVPQLDDPAMLTKAKQLFEREANVLYQLEHPQIPKFREILRVESESGLGDDWLGLYLVQDYVEGPTYRDLLTNRSGFGGHFSEIEITQLLHQLLPVLEYLHDLGIIHRDISPENLILRNTDGLPVLIDFGSVKALVAIVQQQMSATTPAPETTRIGKVGYVPPEQMQMGTTDPTSDLYALAATALVLATGKEPQDLYDSYHGVWNWSQEISLNPTLSYVLDRMLASSLTDRFPSASSVLQALKADDIQTRPIQNGKRARLPELTNIPEISPVSRPNADSNLDLELSLQDQSEPLATIAAVSATETAAASYQAPTAGGTVQNAASAAGCWQAGVGLLALLGLTGLLFWLFTGSQLPRFQLGNPDPSDPVLVNPGGATSLYSDEEMARKADIQTRRETLQVNEDFLIRLTDQSFYLQYPEMRGRSLTNNIEDAPLRLRWDNTASDLLNLLENNLSQRARRELGSYGPANRERWQSAVNQLNVSSRALYDLADTKFSYLFPEQNVDEALPQPSGQIWYGLTDDRVRDLEAGSALEQIQFESGTYSQQLTGQLPPGEGQVLTLDLSAGQNLRLSLQATSGSTLLSLYLPEPTDELPFLLSDSTEKNWSGRLQQSGYYEVVIVSKANVAISYQLNVAVDNVTSTPKEPAAGEMPEEEATDEGGQDGEIVNSDNSEELEASDSEANLSDQETSPTDND